MKTTLATPFTIPASVLQGVHALEGRDKQSRRRRWRVASLQATCTVPPRGRAMSAHTASSSLRRPVRATRDSLPERSRRRPYASDILLRPGKGEVLADDADGDPDGLPSEALPITHFLDAALEYCDVVLLPLFAEEFE
jgi:hypothetical protein